MSIFFARLSALLRRTWVWSLLAVIVIGLLVWLIGPRLAFDDFRPLAETTARLVTLCGLALAWGLWLVFSGWRQARADRLTERVGDDTLPETCSADASIEVLRKGFKQALRTLSQARVYRGRSERWRKSLPWFLLLGPQGSGKTSLIEYSGLNLPLNVREDKAWRPPAPTLGCDWYFAEQGVLLDTSGQYLTQGDAASATGWQTLLKLIARHRRHSPLNGVLITLPITLLLADDHAPLNELAQQVRQRLQDIHQRLRCQTPVYLVLSKADAIRGLECFYDELGPERSQQILGVSCEEGASLDAATLQREFDLLLRHVGSQVIGRTQHERQAKRIGRILDFPRRLGTLATPLLEFVEQALGANRYQPVSPLRGVFLTSAPYRKAEKSAGAASTGVTRYSAPKRSGKGERPLTGRARFIHDLMSRVVFPEAGLARLERREVRRIRWRQAIICTAAVGGLGLMATFWASGYVQNEERFAQLNALGKRLIPEQSAAAALDDAFAALPGLEIRHAALGLYASPSALLLTNRLGLDQRATTQLALGDTYRQALEQQLLPRIARQLQAQLRASLGNRQHMLDSLRAYLMLDDPARRDAAFLTERITTGWHLNLAASPPDQARLAAHLSRLLEQPVRIALDQALIAQARTALRSAPVVELAYQALKDKTRALPGFRFNRYLDPQGELFSGTDYVIPGLYTQESYRRYFLVQGMSLVQQSLGDNWLMGEDSGSGLVETKAMLVELEQRYLRDYADHWGQALGAIARMPIERTSQGADQAARLAAADSPLIKLLAELRNNTLWLQPKEPVGPAADIPQAPSGQLANVANLAVQATATALDLIPDNGRMAVQRRFEAYHPLLDDDGKPGPELTATLQALGKLHVQLATVARAGQPEQAAFQLTSNRMTGNRSAGQPDAINLLRASTARLPQPLGEWLGSLADDSWRLLLSDAYRYINQRYNDELYGVYTEALAKRYPFDARSESDVALADFREFFKARGIAERFFESYLKPFVKGTPDNYSLRSIDGRGLPITLGTLAQLKRLERIRRSFFSENPEKPLIEFRLEPYSLDQQLSRAELRLGDKRLEYRHGPIVPLALQWPAAADNGVASLVVEQPGGRQVGYQEDSGPWSLFRLIERMETQFHSGRDVLMLKADIQGSRVNYLLMSQRSPNPFVMDDLRGFRLPTML